MTYPFGAILTYTTAARSQVNRTQEAMELWAIQVTTGEEIRAAERIRERIPGVKIVIPMREIFEKRGFEWRSVIRTMLPGYIFAMCEIDRTRFWHGIRRANGVLHILGGMEASDAERLRILANGGAPWSASRCRNIGGRLEIYEGSLVGHEDWVVAFDRHRRRARIQLRIGEDIHTIDVGMVQDDGSQKGRRDSTL